MGDLVKINCNLCGMDDYVVISKRGFPFHKQVRNVICKRCGLVYQNPIMGPKALKAYYEDYRKITINISEPTEEYERYARPMSKYHYSFFSEYCKPGMNILDIGCGAGTLMSWAVLGGLNAYGVNPDPGFAKFGLVHYGLKEVQICLFEEACFSPAIFDIITLNHVFEHFSDAVASIEKIRSYLKENGLLYLSIPNLLTPHGQIEYNFFLEHVNTFSVKTISLLLKKMGFKIIKLSTFGYVTETSLHHPYIDLVARKMNVSIPQAIDWQSEREDYLFIKGFLRDYQRGFFKKNGRLRVFWGDLKQLVTSYVKNKSWFISISANYPKFLKHLINNYVHTEPDYCVAPKVTVFPPEECIYYE